MTETQAYKYAELFKILSDNKILIILDFLREKGSQASLEEIAKKAKISEEKARSYCEMLEREYILDQTDEGEVDYYKFMNSSVANNVDYILERLV